MITAITNGVNLTDGLDGLAAGASVLTFGGFTLHRGLAVRPELPGRRRGAGCYAVRDPLDLTTFAVACAGACFGFLWWNTSPAQIFMGDTGSLALGGAHGGAGDHDPHGVPVRAARRAVRAHHAVGDRAGRLVQADRAGGCCGWHRCTTTSRCSAGRRSLIVVRFWLIQGLCIARGLCHLLRRVDPRMSAAPSSWTRWPGTPTGRTVDAGVAGIGVAGFAAADGAAAAGRARAARSTPATDAASRSAPRSWRSWAPTSASVPATPCPTDSTCWSSRPGLPPQAPIIAAAQAAGVPVWGELELAWRLRPAHGGALAGRHRHERQDHHDADARVDAARRRACGPWPPATSASRWSRS